MHPTLDEMLALREGNANPDVVAHAAACGRCQAELERLEGLRAELRRLPQLEPPPGGWEGIRAAVRGRQQFLRRRRWAVAAAAVIAGVGVWLVAGRVDVARRGAGFEAAESTDVAELIAASGELERALKVPSLQSRVLTPREAARIVLIEDQIALVDLRLSRASSAVSRRQTVELWSDRIELLDALVQARGGATGLGVVRTANEDDERSLR